jgi:outer membrane protein assembly factor BamE (lipoprotein component of BamABCDE complex)
MMRLHAILPVSAFVLLAACSTVQFGREFDPAQFEARVERGVTTREAVRAWLGEPSARGTAMNEQGERFEEWSYYHGRGTLPNLKDAQLKVLQVRFDTQGRVMSYSWTGDAGK